MYMYNNEHNKYSNFGYLFQIASENTSKQLLRWRATEMGGVYTTAVNSMP